MRSVKIEQIRQDSGRYMRVAFMDGLITVAFYFATLEKDTPILWHIENWIVNGVIADVLQ